MRILGRHLVAELTGCNRARLEQQEFLERSLDEAIRRSGATKVRSVFHCYNPQGISGVVVIAESHFSVHTWPEYGYAALDFFTCGEAVNPQSALEYMRDALEATEIEVRDLKRGIPSLSDEVIDHKPTQAGVSTSG